MLVFVLTTDSHVESFFNLKRNKEEDGKKASGSIWRFVALVIGIYALFAMFARAQLGIF